MKKNFFLDKDSFCQNFVKSGETDLEMNIFKRWISSFHSSFRWPFWE